MEFQIIENDRDIEILMRKFFFFHDSCIKEIMYRSGGYVAEDGAMFPFNSDRSLSIIFQNQNKQAIEMKFEKIDTLYLKPKNEDYDCVIYSASIKKINNLYYWSEWDNFSIKDIDNSPGTWISAENIKWRFLENHLGPAPSFGISEEL